MDSIAISILQHAICILQKFLGNMDIDSKPFCFRRKESILHCKMHIARILHAAIRAATMTTMATRRATARRDTTTTTMVTDHDDDDDGDDDDDDEVDDDTGGDDDDDGNATGDGATEYVNDDDGDGSRQRQ